MCGIFGAAGPSLVAETYDPNAALEALAHRGPDGAGVWVGDRVVIGHLRLAIIDLSDRASQPMPEATRNTVLSFNGEIYNYVELRDELTRLGWKFESESDTEVILKGYCQWGSKVFGRLNGMFALAIYDGDQKKLLLARDHAGIKPLYFARDSTGTLHFASEIKGLPAGVRSQIETARISEYFYFGSIHDEGTLVAGVRKVLPGSVLCFDVLSGGLRQDRYWELPCPDERPVRDIPKKKLKAELSGLRSLLIDAVGRQLVSDRPLGVFLSGGVDSSAIACIAAEYHGRKLEMFTARFRSARDDTDVRKAAELCKFLGCQHHVLEIDDRISVRNIDLMLDSFDGPFADAAAIPLTLLSQAIPQETKVILQGDGGDEIFGGYPRYRYLQYRDWLYRFPAIARSLRSAFRHSSSGLPRRLQRFIYAVSEPELAIALARFLTVEFPEDRYSPDRVVPDIVGDAMVAFESHRKMCAGSGPGGAIDAALSLDFESILPDVFLEKVDRATMAASIEVRVPFLDRELVEFAGAVPAARKLSRGVPKAMLRAALDGVVPNFILNAPKRGFGVPYGNWIRGPLLNDVRSEVFDCPIYNGALAARMICDHASGKEDHSFMLWKMFLFARWLRRSSFSFA